MTETTRIVRSYEESLRQLRLRFAEFAGIVEHNLELALNGLARRDTTLAPRLEQSTQQLYAAEHEISTDCVRLLALRQPLAKDLRLILTTYRIVGTVERVGEYATGIARRIPDVTQDPMERPLAGIIRLGRQVQTSLKDALDAYLEYDHAKAITVWRQDDLHDELYYSLFAEVMTSMKNEPKTVLLATQLLFIAKNLERVGDHAVHIAVAVHFMVTGNPLREYGAGHALGVGRQCTPAMGAPAPDPATDPGASPSANPNGRGGSLGQGMGS